MYGFHVIKVLDKSPAKKYGFAEPIPEANNDTPEMICTRGLESDKIKELAPAYLAKLRKDVGVEILDPNLKAASDALLNATNRPTATDSNN
jgi:parvulin-like peptidyl-prolyl isomerase